MTKIKARCMWHHPTPPFCFKLQRDIITMWTVCHMSAIVPLFWRKNFVFSCIWGEFLALVKLMGILPLPCQKKISHMKRKIIKKTLYRQKINLKGHWESKSQVQMERVRCHSSFTSDLLMGVVICEKVLPQSAVRFVKIGFSVWVFFYKNIWLPSPSKYHYFS